jgi:molybdopterin converting factor small subunit
MNVNLKCFAILADANTCDYRDSTPYELAVGQTVDDLIKRAEIAREDVKVAFVNGRIADFDTVLYDGDRIALSPAVGGM